LQACLDSKKGIKKVCPSRWVECRAPIIRFTELLEPIVTALDKISVQRDESGTRATSLLRAICNTEFIIAIHVMNEMAALFLSLSEALQTPDIDLIKSMSMAKEVLDILRIKRGNAEAEFHSINTHLVLTSGDQLDIDIKLPRPTGHQVYRENHEASFPEEFYRRTVHTPHLENLIHQMEVRFLPTEQLCLKLQYLIPAFLKRGSFLALQDTLDMYSCDVDSSLSVLKAEYDRWMMWSSVPNSKLPANILETLAVCKPSSFPNIHTLLPLFGTLPVNSNT